MLAIILSFFIISYVLFSFGNIFLSIYNKFCKTNANYNILETVILGVCFLSFLLPATSLWLPSNHYILLTYIIISIIYWSFNRKKLQLYISLINVNCKKLSTIQLCFIALTLLLFTAYLIIGIPSYDSGYYHYQNIRWNEEFSIVPGLGNIEDRFGFNSNILLLSAIFTFRFLFGQAVYMLPATLFLLILLWSINKLFRSNYELRYILVFISLFIIFILMNSKTMLADTSTDAIPLLFIFYYIIKTSLTPIWLNKQPLLAFLLPITLITFKLSCAVFCIVCIIILISCLKEKKYKVIIFLLSCSLLIVGLWLVRNIIITGYLIYPFYQLDLFSFDWKMPKGTAMLQKEHIYYWAKNIFDTEFINRVFLLEWKGVTKLELIRIYMNLFLFIFVMLSPLLLIVNYIKKYIFINKNIYYIYIISLICIIFGLISAPDFRFMDGLIVGIFSLILNILFQYYKKARLHFRKQAKYIVVIICLCCIFITIKQNLTIYKTYFYYTDNKYAHLWIKPLVYYRGIKISEYKMGDITIYITEKDGDQTCDMLPATNPGGIPFYPFFNGNKLQSIETVENRGKTLQDGFRTKPQYINIINNRVDEFISIYHKKYKK